MNILLDTHIALWAITDSPRLSETAKSDINHPKNTIWVSVVTLWEIAIKSALGRGDMPIDAKQALDYFRQSGYHILSIEAEHTLQLAQLPNHHQDPFDRLLVAQALSEPMRLMTHDMNIIKYGDIVIGV
jgi:PIN domain nuclease of toxin-antitoxin system